MIAPFIPREIYEEAMSPTARELSSRIEALYKAKSKTSDMMRLFCFHHHVDDDNTIFRFPFHMYEINDGNGHICDMVASGRMPIKVELRVSNSEVFTVDEKEDVEERTQGFISESSLSFFNTEAASHNSMLVGALCDVCENGFDVIVDGKTEKYGIPLESIVETKHKGHICDYDLLDASTALFSRARGDVDTNTPLVAVMSPRTMTMYICNRDQSRFGFKAVSGPNISSVDEIGDRSTICGIKLYYHPMMVDHSVYVFVPGYTVGCFDKGATSIERLFYTDEQDFIVERRWTGEIRLQRRWSHKVCVARPYSLVQIKIK